MSTTTKKERGNLYLRPEWLNAMEEVDDATAGALCKAIINYWCGKDPGELPENIRLAFAIIRNELDQEIAYNEAVKNHLDPEEACNEAIRNAHAAAVEKRKKAYADKNKA